MLFYWEKTVPSFCICFILNTDMPSIKSYVSSDLIMLIFQVILLNLRGNYNVFSSEIKAYILIHAEIVTDSMLNSFIINPALNNYIKKFNISGASFGNI